MSDYVECTKVGFEFLGQTNNVILVREVVKATPEQIFEVFEDAHSWTVWALPIQKVEWTSPRPFGVGTTRNVHMMGGLIGYEEFIEWKPGRRMAFTFVADNKGATEKFLEDYRVIEWHDGTYLVEWYMAMEPRGFSKHMMFLTRPIMWVVNKLMFRKFRKYTEAYARGEITLGATA